MSMQVYAYKINELLAKMFAILPRILPVNKASCNEYLEEVYAPIYSLTASLSSCYVNEGLQVSLIVARRLNDFIYDWFSGEICVVRCD
jgi:hypothetical protein